MTVNEITNTQAPIFELERQQIEGYVMIKRKTRWVQRYAQIRDGYFQYKETRQDISARFMIDLRKAEVLKGTLDKKEYRFFYQITDKKAEQGQKTETVRVAFDDEQKYKEWGKVFAESIKSDE